MILLFYGQDKLHLNQVGTKVLAGNITSKLRDIHGIRQKQVFKNRSNKSLRNHSEESNIVSYINLRRVYYISYLEQLLLLRISGLPYWCLHTLIGPIIGIGKNTSCARCELQICELKET